jgi:hypothetical protein
MSLWTRALATSRNSATHLWSNLIIIGSGALEAVSQYSDDVAMFAADLFGDPDLKAQLKSLVPDAKWPLVLIGIMVVTKIARNRTLAK